MLSVFFKNVGVPGFRGKTNQTQLSHKNNVFIYPTLGKFALQKIIIVDFQGEDTRHKSHSGLYITSVLIFIYREKKNNFMF